MTTPKMSCLAAKVSNTSGDSISSNSTEGLNTSGAEQHVNYLCEQYLVQYAVPYLLVGLTFLVLGILGNSLTVAYIINKRLFKNPTFAVIALLSITDLIALLVRGSFYMVILLTPMTVSFRIGTHLLWIAYLTLNASNFHIILLARLRYQLIKHPLRRVTVTSRDIVKLSVFAWTLSAIVGILYSLSVYLDLDHISVVVAEMVSDAFSFFSVTIPVLLYHHLKVRRLKKRFGGRNTTTRMSIVITLILSMQVLSIATFLVSGVLAAYNIFSIVLTFGTHAFLMFNHTVNPYIYFLVIMCYSRTFSRRNSYRKSLQAVQNKNEMGSQV